jgi:predicted site-specific integrase-resolvase
MTASVSELEDEIAHLRDFDLPGLRARWHSVFRRRAPDHLPRHLLYRMIAYRLQAERLGDLDRDTQRFLERVAAGAQDGGKLQAAGDRPTHHGLKPGAILVRDGTASPSASWSWTRLRLEWYDLSQLDADRVCHDRDPLVRPSFLRASHSRGEAGMTTKPAKRVRCAVYTRVSTEYGLDQEFNSLDAQHEASEAYVRSQDHDGWTLIRTRYDDGGYSGGSTERPALQRLLADIRDRRIDIVVVYKVDRLTRSLADFPKLVELFDAHDVSFVPVTQQFNTTPLWAV